MSSLPEEICSRRSWPGPVRAGCFSPRLCNCTERSAADGLLTANRPRIQARIGTMEKPAHAQFPIHELVARRWSPRAFDERPIGADLLRTLFEAARWAPSSNN